MEFTSIASRYRYVDTLISRNSARVASNVASLSSGKRMVHAGDDVASLSIATKLRARTTTIRSNLTNLAQAGTMLQVMDGALKEVDNILQRLNALATMANSGGISDTERSFLQIEVNNLTGEIDRMLGETNFNGVALFGDGYHTPAAEVPEADIASLYDAKGLTSGTYTVRAGDTVFDTYVETLGEGDNQENWLLIGRGRDGWEFDDDGQGDISLLAGGLGTPGAFDPVALDSTSINALLEANGLGLDDIEIRIKRAADEGGQSYQELRERPLGAAQWTWQFGVVDYDTDYEVRNSALGVAFTDTFSSMADSTLTLTADSGDNYQRLLTNADPNVDINGGVRGFQYGATVTGTMGISNTSFFWDSGVAGHAMPYTEVYIRVKDNVTRNKAADADEFVDPRSIKGLELWLDANDLDGDGTSEGLNEAGQAAGNVSVWKDKSGNGADLLRATATGPTTGARTINGINALDFNGAQAMVNTANAADLYGDEYTWYVVAEKDDLINHNILMYAKDGALGINPGGPYDGFGTGAAILEQQLGFGAPTESMRMFQQDGAAGNESHMSPSNALGGNTEMLGASWKIGERATAYVNGTSVTKYNNDTQANIIPGQGLEATTFVLGAHGSTTVNLNRWHDGAIAEVIVVSNKMSTDELQRLESYLAEKWGLDGNLPDYHLFKSESPYKALDMKISDAYANDGVLGNVNVNDYENVTFSIEGGAYKDSFSIDATTGEIRVTDTSKLLALSAENIQLRIRITGEGVGGSDLMLPVNVALDKRYVSFQVLDQGEKKNLLVSVDHFNTQVLFDKQTISVATQDDAAAAAEIILAAIDRNTSFRAEVGSKQSAVNILTDYNSQALRNQDDARSIMEDTNIATASTEFSTNQVKTQMAIAMAAQATELQNSVATEIFDSINN